MLAIAITSEKARRSTPARRRAGDTRHADNTADAGQAARAVVTACREFFSLLARFAHVIALLRCASGAQGCSRGWRPTPRNLVITVAMGGAFSSVLHAQTHDRIIVRM